jgi:uncharacterized membrane protein
MRLAVAALIVAAIALSLIFYAQLPRVVPIHWNAAGQIDGYAPKLEAVFVVPAAMLVVFGVFALLPLISPAGYDIETKSRAYRGILFGILAFLLAVHVQLLLAGMHRAPSIETFVSVALGLLFIILGNYMPKMRRNFFVGIRTPWTLADEDVWFRTHRLGGILFVVGGVLLMGVGPFLHGRATEMFLITIVGAAVLVSVVYSYAIYRRPNEKEVSS